MRIGQLLSPDPPVYPVSPVYILSTPSKKSPLASALRCNSTPEIGGISEDEFACESIRPAFNDVDDVVLAGVDGSLLCLQACFNELGLVDRSDLQCATMKCKTYAEVSVGQSCRVALWGLEGISSLQGWDEIKKVWQSIYIWSIGSIVSVHSSMSQSMSTFLGMNTAVEVLDSVETPENTRFIPAAYKRSSSQFDFWWGCTFQSWNQSLGSSVMECWSLAWCVGIHWGYNPQILTIAPNFLGHPSGCSTVFSGFAMYVHVPFKKHQQNRGGKFHHHFSSTWKNCDL